MLPRGFSPLGKNLHATLTTKTKDSTSGVIECIVDSIKKLENDISTLEKSKEQLLLQKLQYAHDIESLTTYIQQMKNDINQKNISKEQQNISEAISVQNGRKTNQEHHNHTHIEHKTKKQHTKVEQNIEPQAQTTTIQQFSYFQQNTDKNQQLQGLQPPKQQNKQQKTTQDNTSSNQNQENDQIATVNVIIESQNQKYNQKTVMISYLLDTKSVICALDFDPTGRFFAFADTRSLHIVNVSNGQILLSTPMNCPMQRNEIHSRALKFSIDGQLVAVGIAPSSIGLFSLVTQKFIQIFEGHSQTVTSLLFDKTSIILLSASIDGTICLWNLATLQFQNKIDFNKNHNASYEKENSIISVVPLNDIYYVVGFLSGIVRIYDNNFATLIYNIQAYNCLMFSMVKSIGNELITASEDGEIKIWNISNQGAICRNVIKAHSSIITCMCTSNTENILLTGSKDETIKGWDLNTGNNLFTAKLHSNTIMSLAHHPVSNMFLSSSGDGLISAWFYP